MVKLMSNRTLCLIGFLTCVALIAIALYFQYVEGLEPCPLCIFQRVAFIVMGVLFLIFALHNPSSIGRKIYSGLLVIAGLVGAGIAGWHVRLQNLPEDQVPECGPGLEFMWDAFPLTKFLETVFKGSGECAEVSWTFLGLTMPGWSLVWLVVLTLFSIYLMLRKAS